MPEKSGKACGLKFWRVAETRRRGVMRLPTTGTIPVAAAGPALETTRIKRSPCK
jgi:hypothetical protein